MILLSPCAVNDSEYSLILRVRVYRRWLKRWRGFVKSSSAKTDRKKLVIEPMQFQFLAAIDLDLFKIYNYKVQIKKLEDFTNDSNDKENFTNND